MIQPLSPFLTAPTPTAAKGDPEKIASTAGEFEALLIGSLLKSMREAGGAGWLGTGDDKSSESLMELAEQQLAQMMAAQGGLGLARVVAQGLTQESGGQAAAEPSTNTNPSGSR